MANLVELFWFEPLEAHHLLEGWGDSEYIIRQALPELDQLMGRPVYLQANPDADVWFWRCSQDSTCERYIGPTHVVGLSPELEQTHFLVAPLPLGFVERRGHMYIIQVPTVDFTDNMTYLEVPVRITKRQFWGYDHSEPVYIVQVAWRCFGVEHRGWEFESLMQHEFIELFHRPVYWP